MKNEDDVDFIKDVKKLSKKARGQQASKYYLRVINEEKTEADKVWRMSQIIKAHERTWPQLLDTAVWIAILIIATLFYFQGKALYTIVHTTDAIWVETCEGQETGYIEFYDEGGNPNGREIDWKFRDESRAKTVVYPTNGS